MNDTTNILTPATPETAKGNADCLQRLVRRLFETRQEAKQAKRARRELAEKIGGCEYHDPTASDEDAGLPCHYSKRPKEKWCDVCKQKLPLWEDFHRKTNLAAAALRELMRAAKKPSESPTSQARPSLCGAPGSVPHPGARRGEMKCCDTSYLRNEYDQQLRREGA